MNFRTVIFTGLLFAASALPAFASESIEHYNGTYDGSGPYTVDEYSRNGTTVDLTFTNAFGGNGTATVQCGNPAGGSWAVKAISGLCYDKNFCEQVPTADVEAFKSGPLAGKPIVSEDLVPGTEGQVTNLCYRLYREATGADVSTRSGVFSQCSGGNMKSLPGAQGGDVKKHCVFNYTGASGIKGKADAGELDDDMFRVEGNAGAYLEYVDRGSTDDPNRLKFVSRSGTGEVMVPTGPHSGAHEYRDYDLFMMRPQGGVEVQDACYPVKLTVCADADVEKVKPPVRGICGSAQGKTFDDAAAVPAGDRCYLGHATGVTDDGNNGLHWTCEGIQGGADASCSAIKKNPDDPIVTTDPPPPEQTDPPTAACFFHVSGLLFDNEFMESWYSEIGKVDMYSNLVGPGNYSQAEPFVRANTYTFDGIAIGKDTHITIYSQPNFGGTVLLDLQGPAVVNNVLFNADTTPNNGQWLTDTWPGDFDAQFPPSTRHWSSTDMHPWGMGTSVKVSCSSHAACGSSNGQTMSSAPTDNLCSQGTASDVHGNGPWNWTCTDSDHNTVSCAADPVASAACTWTRDTTPEGCSYQRPDMQADTDCASFTGFSVGGPGMSGYVGSTCIVGAWAGDGKPYGSCGSSSDQAKTRTYKCVAN